MKKKFIFLFIALLLNAILFTSCTHNEFLDYNSDDYLQLYDYKSITCDYDYTQITFDDVIAIIETEMSVNEAYMEINSRNNIEAEDIVLLTINDNPEYYFVGSESYSENFDKSILKMFVDETKIIYTENYGALEVTIIGIYRTATIDDINFVLSYYNFSDFNQLENYIRSRASDEIIFNYSYDIIFENSSLISFPTEIEKQIISDEITFKEQILEYYYSFDDYLLEYEMTEEDFHNSISSNYYELLLYKAILDKENITITSEDILKYKTENELYEYNDYDIFKEIAFSLVRDILVSTTIVK